MPATAEAAFELELLECQEQIIQAVAPPQALDQSAADQAISAVAMPAGCAILRRHQADLIPEDNSRLLQLQRGIVITKLLQLPPAAQQFGRHGGIAAAMWAAVPQQLLVLHRTLRLHGNGNHQGIPGGWHHLHLNTHERTAPSSIPTSAVRA